RRRRQRRGARLEGQPRGRGRPGPPRVARQDGAADRRGPRAAARRTLRHLRRVRSPDPPGAPARRAVRHAVRRLPEESRGEQGLTLPPAGEAIEPDAPGGGRFKARAGLLSVLGLLYASGCAGPYGTENYVAQAGPGLLILLLFVFPWIWSVPMALA